MPVIKIQVPVNAPVEIVFDLARSIDLHTISTAHTNEKAVGGTISGLINKEESVTWRARHFGIMHVLTSIISEMDVPNYFVDEMVSGPFKKIRHEHFFKVDGSLVLMTDVFYYESPFGILGKLADRLFLKKYMSNFLIQRNAVIKEYAENKLLYERVFKS